MRPLPRILGRMGGLVRGRPLPMLTPSAMPAEVTWASRARFARPRPWLNFGGRVHVASDQNEGGKLEVAS